MAKTLSYKIELLGTDTQIKRLSELDQETKELSKSTSALSKRAIELKQAGKEQSKTYQKVTQKMAENKREHIKVSAEKTKLRNIIKQEVNLQNTSANTIGKVNAQLSIEKKRILELAVGSKKFNVVAKRIKNLEKKQRDFNAQLGRGRTFVGEYEKGIIGAFKNIGLAVGGALIIFRGFQRVIGGGIEVVADFEKSITNVFTLLSDKDADQFSKSLSEGSLQIMKDFGFAIEDTNKALFDTVSAGIPAGESIAFLNEVSKLAIGGVTDLSTAVDGVTTVVNAFGLEVSDTERVTSAFFTAQKFGKTTVEELSNAIGEVAPIANQAGVGFEQLLATFAELTKQGINTTQSATAIKSTLTALIAPSKDAQKEFKRLGIPFGATALKAEGLAKILGSVAKASEQDADALSKLIPNVRALTGVGALGTAQLAEMDMILKAITEDVGDASSLTKAYEQQQATLDQTTKRLTAEIRVLVIEIGEKLKPTMNAVLEIGLSLVQGLKDHASTIKTVAKAIGIVVASYISWRVISIAVTFAMKNLTIASIKQNVVTKAGTLLTKLWRGAMLLASAGMNLLRGNTVRATVAMRAFNIATKSNPVGLLVGLLTTAVAMFASFGSAVAQTTDELNLQKDAQDGLNKAVEEGNRVRSSVKTIEEDIKALDKLNTAQVEGLRDRINQEIKLLDEADGIREKGRIRAMEDIIRLEGLIKEAKDKGDDTEVFERALQFQLDTQAKAGAQRIKAELGLTESYIKIKGAELDEFTKLVDARMVVLANEGDGKKKLTEAEVKAEKKKHEKLKKLRDEFAEERRVARMSEEAREIHAILKRAEALEQAGVEEQEIAEFTEEKILKIRAKFREKNAKEHVKDLNAQINRISEHFDLQLLEAERTFLEERLLAVQNHDNKFELEQQHQKSITQLRRRQLEATRVLLANELTLLQDQLDEVETGTSLLSDEESTALRQKINDIKIALSQLGIEFNNIATDEAGQKFTLSQQLGLDDDGLAVFMEGANEVMAVLDNISSINQANTDIRINNLNRETQTQVDGINRQIAEAERQGKSTEALEKRKSDLLAKRDNQERKIRTQQAVDLKKIQVAQAIIGGANAVVQVLQQPSLIPDPANTIFKVARVVAVVAQTAKQIQLINSTPAFKRGGKIPGSFDGRDDVHVRVSRGEAIVNPRQQALLGGSGAFSRAGVPGFQTGGVPLPVPNLSQRISEQVEGVGLSHSQAIELIEAGINTIVVEQVESEVTESQQRVETIEATAKF